jgi:beta-lactamase class A
MKRLLARAVPIALLLLAACSGTSDPRSLGALAERSTNHVATTLKIPDAPLIVPLKPSIPSAAIHLDEALQRLGRRFDGEVGIAVRDVATGWTSHYRGLDYFPQQSVSKLWVALGIFDRIDRGVLRPDAEIVVRPEDLTLFHQPIRAMVLRSGVYRTTIEELLVRALTQSDNTASDRLLTELGGADAVRAMLAAKAINGVRFGPGERLLQSQTAGLDWQQAYATGARFYAARDALPAAARRQAFDAYAADPIDGATPYGIVDALARLSVGQLLSARSTDRMTEIMRETRTGALRLKSGLQPGWRLAHKTGTGQVFEGEQAGYNDVGILTSPSGRTYAIAVLIGRTARPLAERSALIRGVVAATIGYDADFAAQVQAAGL